MVWDLANQIAAEWSLPSQARNNVSETRFKPLETRRRSVELAKPAAGPVLILQSRAELNSVPLDVPKNCT